ncbi:conserved Plasmodium protein, unknown function [Plasmodium knowlesi strain H]|uniref:Uncharacterized protein n=3 Tax=Plasmodium knowlesi TaxID=5850 RepID=A0A5K1UE57_PLAKH|nr:conserved protein, unknown function [Plasmodium knowlesi strain H]OTN66371.1 Uncharacterized protein PKNOH_S09540900 [Plasmodium knowlesi]CAA9989904.1 conserved protein, unknown function [Plasmodium knowlesi strain H]SBO24470.1 conserved Plasmodium protein, unknown function [Plasmodium knowlesi strain H]SBO26513.1 conserved Plasmodium protein, unknown function [Plasmodium knowlesi strain H]VVS79378.1 conserved protein, unknown function [Plasmodium knowlesi strain H]|eukprot:XP_002259920.1 hypothetical protein, conserved in Plasmodium species [Plasmodium knowlesi strain H]
MYRLANGRVLLRVILLLVCRHIIILVSSQGCYRKSNCLAAQVTEAALQNGVNIWKRPYYFVTQKRCPKNRIRKISNKLYEANTERPERKLDCYELNIRNDKKFEKYAKKPVSPMSNMFYFSPFKNIISSFEPVEMDIKRKLREEGFQYENEKSDSNIFPSLDEIIRDGDPSTNMHFYRRKRLKSLLYRDPNRFVNARKFIENYNKRAPPDKQINYDLFRCDIFYVHSDGTIMNIEENRPPYDKKLEESDRDKEPRFVIQAAPGHAKERNLKVGDKFPVINEEQKKILFDNHFAKPKKIRDPLVLPDGRKIP